MTEPPRDRDVDAEFAAIVARWDDEFPSPDDDGSPPTATPAPAADPEATARREARPDDPAPDEETPGEGDPPASAREALTAPGWRVHLPPEPEEHFDPPAPAPLPPAADWHFWAILAGLGGGPALLLVVIVFFPQDSGWWLLLAIGATVAGFVLLVLRRSAGTEEDDDGIRL